MFKRKTNKPANGRKYKLALISVLAILAGFAMCAINPVFIAVFSELVTGVLGVLLVYCGGNVGKSWAVGKVDGLTVSSGPTKVYKGPPPGAK